MRMRTRSRMQTNNQTNSHNQIQLLYTFFFRKPSIKDKQKAETLNTFHVRQSFNGHRT